MKKSEFESAIKSVFNACRHLSEISGGTRKFTPDGGMVGDIGEVLAKFFYGVDLHKEGRHDWDGTYNGRNVQIKATGGKETYLKEPPKEGFADGLLMVFYIDRENGKEELVYNGDIQRVWDALKKSKVDRIGPKMISLDRLRKLQKLIHPKDRV